MKARQRLTHQIAQWVLERPARSLSLAELARRLEDSGEQITHHLQTVADTPSNRAQLRHITGIEAWGQARLRAGFGGPLVMDEYDNYRPDADASWNDLRASFRTTRATTIELVREIGQTQLDPARTIPHNQFGPLTVRAWLRYLTLHASFESKRIR